MSTPGDSGVSAGSDGEDLRATVGAEEEAAPDRPVSPPDAYALAVRPGAEVAVFVTRRNGSEVLIVHRSPVQGGYWHVVAGGIEPGEEPVEAARRELREETRLAANLEAGPRVVEYWYPLTEEPAERRKQYDPSVATVQVFCFRCHTPDEWEPILDWEHDDYCWCTPAEAAAALRWPETARALREVIT
jgi:8-oxo-dGTP pyrophosphatase MutT (NUDIX family)